MFMVVNLKTLYFKLDKLFLSFSWGWSVLPSSLKIENENQTTRL